MPHLPQVHCSTSHGAPQGTVPLLQLTPAVGFVGIFLAAQQQQHEPVQLAAILLPTCWLGRKLRGPVCSLRCLVGSDLLPPLPRMLCRAAWRTSMRSRRRRRRRMRPTRRRRCVGWSGSTWLCSWRVKQARSGQPGAHLISDSWSFTSLPHCSVCITPRLLQCRPRL